MGLQSAEVSCPRRRLGADRAGHPSSGRCALPVGDELPHLLPAGRPEGRCSTTSAGRRGESVRPGCVGMYWSSACRAAGPHPVVLPQGRYNNHGTLVPCDSGRYASADHDPVVLGWSAVPAAGPVGFTFVEHRRLPPQYRRRHGDVRRDDRIRTPAAQYAGGPVAAGGGNNISASLFAPNWPGTADDRCAERVAALRFCRWGTTKFGQGSDDLTALIIHNGPRITAGRQRVPERNADRGAARPREHPCCPRVQVGRLARTPHPSLMPLARRGICWCCTRLLRSLPIGTYTSPSDSLLRNRSWSTDRTATRSGSGCADRPGPGSSRHRNRLDQVVSPAGRNRVTMRVRVS
jgi:hypothetical protein